MNFHMIKLAFSGLAATLALAAPGIGWAGDHYLGLINVVNSTVNNTAGPGTCLNAIPSTVLADKAIVDGGSGAVVAANPLTLSGLCAGNGNSVSRDFTGTLTLQFRQVKMCKSWTAKNNTTVYDWLDQGNTRIGATGTLTGSQGGNYRVVLTMTEPVPVSTAPGTCTADNQGAYDYTVTRIAQVDRNDGTNPSPIWINLATANFTFGNTAPQGNVPEPGTLSLIGLGLAGLGWVGARRARKARASSI